MFSNRRNQCRKPATKSGVRKHSNRHSAALRSGRFAALMDASEVVRQKKAKGELSRSSLRLVFSFDTRREERTRSQQPNRRRTEMRKYAHCRDRMDGEQRLNLMHGQFAMPHSSQKKSLAAARNTSRTR